MISESLIAYLDTSILPLYDHFDAAHRRDHVRMVIKQSMQIAHQLDVDEAMVYTIAVYHDTGLNKERKTHHIVSGQIVREDRNLKNWFNEQQIETIAQAVEDHRASSNHEPRSIYGKIVAEADRYIEPMKIIKRTVQYGLEHYPELNKEEHYKRTLQHMHEKYAEGGYLKLWFPESPNRQRLEALQTIIRDEEQLKSIFEEIFNRLIS